MVLNQRLFDGDFSSANRAAAEGANFASSHFNDAITSSVNGEVAAHSSADTWALGHANLADNDLADRYNLAAKQLNT